MVPNTPREPERLELWRLIAGNNHMSYVAMVWSVEDDAPYWFRSVTGATEYIEARRDGDTERAEKLAESHA